VQKYKETGTRNNPLTEEQKANNKEKPKTRSRVEHVLTLGSMNKFKIGIKRASSAIELINMNN
jgi:hypothetical protein